MGCSALPNPLCPCAHPRPQAWAAWYEDAHSACSADLTPSAFAANNAGRNLRGRIMPAWKRTHAKAPEPKDREVGQLIRAQRLVCRMSQTELANALGVTFQQVQKYEKGVNRVGAGRLARIADTLGVPISFFFEGSDVVRQGIPARFVDLLDRRK